MKLEKLKNITWLVENGGQVSIGRHGPVRCAAIACDESSQLAALVKRNSETIEDLLARLDTAIGKALEEEVYTNELNG